VSRMTPSSCTVPAGTTTVAGALGSSPQSFAAGQADPCSLGPSALPPGDERGEAGRYSMRNGRQFRWSGSEGGAGRLAGKEKAYSLAQIPSTAFEKERRAWRAKLFFA
jgi:hypothetical protein